MTDKNTPTAANMKPYAITNIKAYVPLTLDLNQLNYDSWRELFQTHSTGFSVLGHLNGTSKPTGDDDTEWQTLDSLVKMWIYGTLTQSLLNMVTKPGSTAHSLWLAIEALFRDNKYARIIELDNELRLMTMGDRSVNEYYEKMKVTADLLANIGSPVSERTLVAYFLNGLSPKYDHIATVIRHKEPLPTLHQARSTILLEEPRITRTRQAKPSHTDHASAPTVLYTGSQTPSQNRSNNNRNNQSRNRGGPRDNRREPTNDNRRQPTAASSSRQQPQPPV